MPHDDGEIEDQNPDLTAAADAENVVHTSVDAEYDLDKEGKLLDLSQQSGVDVSVLRPQTNASLQYLKSLPTRADVLRQHTDIAKWMADNPEHGALAADSVESLEQIKNNMSFHEKLRKLAQEDYRRSNPTFGDRAEASAFEASSGFVSGLGAIAQSGFGMARMAADVAGADNAAQWAGDKARVWGDITATATASLTNGNFDDADRALAAARQLTYLKGSLLGSEISAGDVGGVLASTIPALVAGPFGWGALVTTAGAQTAGGAYQDLRERGESVGKAGTIALLEGTITGALTHFIPGLEGSIHRSLTASTSRTMAARSIFSLALGKTMASEMTEEGLDQFAQTILNEATDTKNPREWPDILNHAVREGIKAGLLGAISGGVFGVGEARHAAHVQTAANFREDMGKLAAALDKAPLAQRSKVAAESFLFAQGMKADSVLHMTAEDMKPLMSGSPEQMRSLAALGITPEAVEKARSYGGSLQVQTSKVMTAEPGLREQLLDIGRQTASSLNSVEAKEEQKTLDEHKAEAKQKADESSKFIREVHAEEAKTVKSFAAAAGVDEQVMRKLHAPLFSSARTLSLTDPEAARSVLDMLKRWRVAKTGQTRDEIAQQIVDLAGPEGKTAMSQIHFSDLGQLSGRLDTLTGQFDLNAAKLPDAVSVGQLIKAAKGKGKLDLAGRTVHVQGEDGQLTQMDAESAVGTLRQRVEAARRLLACIS